MAHLHVDLVTAENNGDVLTDALEVAVPVGDVLVGDAGGDIEHDDTALTVDVVAITKTTKFLLARGIPDVEADRAEVGGERERVNLDTQGSYITSVARSQKNIHDTLWHEKRVNATHQCTSSRIHPSSGARR